MNEELNEKAADIILSMREYIQRAIPETRTLADGFYTEETNEQWATFAQLMEGLQWLFEAYRSIESVRAQVNIPVEWTPIVGAFKSLGNQIAALLPVYENKDRTLIGDMLNYEFLPLFEELVQLLNISVD